MANVLAHHRWNKAQRRAKRNLEAPWPKELFLFPLSLWTACQPLILDIVDSLSQCSVTVLVEQCAKTRLDYVQFKQNLIDRHGSRRLAEYHATTHVQLVETVVHPDGCRYGLL